VRKEIFKQSQTHIALVNIAHQLSNTTMINLTSALRHQVPLPQLQAPHIQLSSTVHPLRLIITLVFSNAPQSAKSSLPRAIFILVHCIPIHNSSIVLHIVRSIMNANSAVEKKTKVGQSEAVSEAQSLL